jgi:chromosome segregation ATPase
MKFIPLILLFSTVSFPIRAEQPDYFPAEYATSYSTQDVTGAITRPIKSFSETIWGFIADTKDKMGMRAAEMTGDAVSISASNYSLALREAERKNEPLKKLKSSQEEAKQLEDLAGEYKKDIEKFEKDIDATLQLVAQDAKAIKGRDQKKQEKLEKLLAERKKLGQKTAIDGDPRHGGHVLLSLSETFSELEMDIMNVPDRAKSIALGKRLEKMKTLLEGATVNLSETQKKMLVVTNRINELAKDENGLPTTPEVMQRRMILGTLNNSVSNLITQAEFSKNRAQLAFSHFADLEKELASKGVKAGDVKKYYRDEKNLKALTDSYNDTPIGVYINSQISKAMGSVCELVNNQCKDGTNSNLFNFLDDSGRAIFKDRVSEPLDDQTNGLIR